jgi:MoaA/NifB/PqqE/SkfB family radical SAM enzyme
MSWELFTKIIGDLSDLNYSGILALHNYNEPLANPRLLQELNYIYKVCPNCLSCIFSNGDFLTRELLEELYKANVRGLRISLYPDSAEPWNREISVKKIQLWLNKKQINSYAEWQISDVRQGVAAVANKEHLNIQVIAPNTERYNYRGGSVSQIVGQARSSPCYITHHSAAIDFRGSFKMCCNVYPEYEPHFPYVVGNLENTSFLALWQSESMQRFREHHKGARWELSPICSKCTKHLPNHVVEKLGML